MWVITNPVKALLNAGNFIELLVVISKIIEIPVFILHELAHGIFVACLPKMSLEDYEFIYFDEPKSKKKKTYLQLRMHIKGTSLGIILTVVAPLILFTYFLIMTFIYESLLGLIFLAAFGKRLMLSKEDKESVKAQWNKIKEKSKQ